MYCNSGDLHVYTNYLLWPLQADLLFRDSTLASLEQECQELREELEGSKMAFERQVEGLKEELELIQEKKISLEVSNFNLIFRPHMKN